MNSIFNFNIKEKKISLKFRSLDHESISHFTSNKNLVFSSKQSLNNFNNLEFDNNKSKNKLNLVDNNNNNCSYISSVLNISDNKNAANDILIKRNITNIINHSNNNSKNYDIFIKSLKSVGSLPKLNFNIDKENLKTNTEVAFTENLKLNLFDILFNTKRSKKKGIELFKLGETFYKKRMDIVYIFTLIIITEKVLIKNNIKNNSFYMKK